MRGVPRSGGDPALAPRIPAHARWHSSRDETNPGLPTLRIKMSRIYVGNLCPDTTEDGLRAALVGSGRTVTHVNLKRDAATGKLRRFAFVDMGSQAEAESAIAELNGTTLDGKQIKVNFAKELPVPGPLREYGSSGGYGGRDRGGRGRR